MPVTNLWCCEEYADEKTLFELFDKKSLLKHLSFYKIIKNFVRFCLTVVVTSKFIC